MYDDRLRQEIARVAARFRQRRFWWIAAFIWLAAALAALAGRWFVAGPEQTRTLVLAAAGGGLAAMLGAMLWMLLSHGPRPRRVARRIESRFPDLRSLLMTAVEMEPELPEGRYGFLQAEVIQRTLRHARTHSWRRVVSRGSLLLAFLGAFVAAGTACMAFVATLLYPAPPIARAVGEPTTTLVEHAFSFTVEPGNTEVERGNTLLVLGRVQGPMPLEAELVYRPADPAKEGEAVRQSMQASLNDPVFGARIGQVQQDLVYHVEIGGVRSPEYRATVFEYPRLERADALIRYPAYAASEDRLVQDVRTISAPEGSNVELTCILNKEVASAVLRSKEDPPLALAKASGAAPHYVVSLPTDQSRRWKLELTDEQGRKNPQQVEFSLTILPNKPASIKPIFPARDLEVSPLEELEVNATAWDDFGVKRFGITYSFALNEPVDVVLGEELAAKEKHERSHTLALEALGAQPDQLLSYYFWTEDLDSTGAVRRNMGDMYFAEVRPFEEIFRQGEQPPGGESQQQQQQQQQQGGQNAQRAQQLAELQKEIINATWKVIRRETGAARTAQFAPDVQLVRESQATAQEQASALGEQLQDEQSRAHLGDVLTAMEEAAKQLQSAQEGADAAPLKSALAAEQKAYQALLKLRAREHEVIRSQQSQQQQQQRSQSRSSQSRSEQQLQQLDLSNEENRYEQQRTAPQEQQESPEQREDRQVLNRLKELARRQHDLNERLKELQNALEEAKTEEQKEEVRRQLQRLQEEQQEILRDTDELQSRMENEQNLERMSQEREQLQQARENTRRASEALEQGRVSQSAATGARAEESFDELKEEFRRRASGQFTERMKDLRQQAQALDQNQSALGEKLAEEAKKAAETKSLREDNARDALLEQLTEQRGRLDQLQEQMKQTITDAEETEPLLSEKLYDAVKDLNEQKPERALQGSSLSLRSGLLEDAQSQERIAAEGIRQLRESVEKAAESVLGDETEALRRARQELNRLSEELERDLARNAPEEASPPRGGEQPGEQPGGERGPDSAAGQESASQRDQDLAEQLGRGAPGERPEGATPPEGGEQQGPQPGGQPGEREGEPQEGQRRQGAGQQGERQTQEGEQREGEPGAQQGQPQEGQPQQGQPQEGQGQPGQQQQQQQQGQPQQGERQPGSGQPGQRGERPEGEPQEGDRAENQQGEPQEGQPGRPGQQGGRRGEPREGEPREGEPREGEPREGERRPGERPEGEPQRGGDRAGDNRGGIFDPNRTGGEWNPSPITGEDFRDWSDRLRDVEEMVDDPALRAEAARIRERARSMRAEARRHSKEPNFKLWRVDVAEPLQILRDRVSEELLRKSAKRAITPIDRDPTPPGFSEKTRRYYEQLGKGE